VQAPRQRVIQARTLVSVAQVAETPTWSASCHAPAAKEEPKLRAAQEPPCTVRHARSSARRESHDTHAKRPFYIMARILCMRRTTPAQGHEERRNFQRSVTTLAWKNYGNTFSFTHTHTHTHKNTHAATPAKASKVLLALEATTCTVFLAAPLTLCVSGDLRRKGRDCDSESLGDDPWRRNDAKEILHVRIVNHWRYGHVRQERGHLRRDKKR